MAAKLDVVSDLKKLIGGKNVSGSLFERVAYGQDAIAPDLPVENIPIAVAKPDSSESLAKIICYANDNKIPVYVHGSGTSFKGSACPKRSQSIVVDTGNYKQLEINEDDFYFEVGAGVNQYDLEIFLQKRGFLLPMNVGSKHGSTIGGAIAVNTIGHMVDSCIGKIIDYVMAVEVVLPNGKIIETGTKSIRRPAGIDLTRFFCWQ